MRRVRFGYLVCLLTVVLAACAPAQPVPTPTIPPAPPASVPTPTGSPSQAAGARLRITNAGSAPIRNLTLLFPEEEVFFGDVPAGGTTSYLPVRNGVYAYAAYRYELDGSLVTQPVIDWVGEEGKQGAFTYTIDFDPSRAAMQRIMQQAVTQDE